MSFQHSIVGALDLLHGSRRSHWPSPLARSSADIVALSRAGGVSSVWPPIRRCSSSISGAASGRIAAADRSPSSGVKGRPRRGVLRRHRRRSVEDDRRRRDWAPVTDGQITSASVGAVAVSETNPGHRLHRHGRVVHPRQHHAGRRRLQVHRRRQDVDARRLPGRAEHLEDPHPPDQSPTSSSSRRSASTACRTTSAASSRAPTAARRGARSLFRDDKTGARRPLDRSQQPERDVRRAVGGVSASSTRCRAAARAAACSSRPTAARPGPRSRATPGCRRASIGRIGVSVSGADSNRVYALVENENGGLFARDDAGATWTLVNENRNIRQRAFYYTHVTADPKNQRHRLPAERRARSARPTAARRSRTSAAARTATTTTSGSIRTTRSTSSSATTAAARSRSAGGDGWTAQDFPTPQYYHVVTTKHIAVSRLRRAAGRQHRVPAEREPAAVAVAAAAAEAVAGAAAPRRRRCTARAAAEPGYDRAGSEGPRRVLRRRQQRRFLDDLNRRTGQSARSASVSAHVLRRAGERDHRARAVDVPDRLLAGRSERALHGDAARLEDDERRTELGPHQRRSRRATIRRRWATPAARSPAT